MTIQVFIEVGAGENQRGKYDAQTLELKELRSFTQPYPYAYGFVLHTHAADGDAVDCYVITPDKLTRGTTVVCEVCGLLEQIEDGEIDHKILAAPVGQHPTLDPSIKNNIQKFLDVVLANYPDTHIHLGEILPKEAALKHLANS